jgi:hypothetical protein
VLVPETRKPLLLMENPPAAEKRLDDVQKLPLIRLTSFVKITLELFDNCSKKASLSCGICDLVAIDREF